MTVRGCPPPGSKSAADRPAVSSLRKKADVVAELRKWNANFKAKWTVDELRATLKNLYEEFPDDTPTVKGLSSLKLEELRDRCRAQQIDFNRNQTRGQLMLLL